LNAIPIEKVSPTEFLNTSTPTQAIYTQLETEDYNKHKTKDNFDLAHFYANPTEYESTFAPYLSTDIFIAAAYWDPKSPVLFTKEDKIGFDVVADITCDIEGSVPTTIRSTTIENPVFDFNTNNWKESIPFSDKGNLSVMSVDNLPCELPRDASESFGEQLSTHVIPELLLVNTPKPITEGATMTSERSLTPTYAYLTDFLEQE
ncbi:MAG: alanine dehydrogenase, partial [Cyclobacteriaceae bacterium]